MRPRQGLVEIFATFLQFEADRFSGWLIDGRLKRSMQLCLKQPTQRESEQFWALYWHKVWQTLPEPPQQRSLAAGHLTAYLQETCYWVAHKIAANFASQQSIADLFQTAIARVDKVLQGFNAQYSTNLKSYAEFVFSNLIKESLRQRQEIDICSDWGLLNKLSQRRLVESLRNLGQEERTIAAYILAWRCFKELYGPEDGKSLRKLSAPTADTWEVMARLYNTERLGESLPETTPALLEKWLISCARAARAFLYPNQLSIDAPRPGMEDSNLLDLIPGQEQASVLDEVILQEEINTRQMQRQEINQFLQQILATLDPEAQALLSAYYGTTGTQQELAQQLGVKQYTISRRLTSLRSKLLQKLATWSQTSLHSSLNADVLAGMSAVLEEWLRNHYSRSNR